MDDEIYVVQQNPFGLVVALDVRGPHPVPGESLLYLIGDGLNLSRVAAATDNKVIGEGAGGLVHLENSQIFGLFRLTSFDRLGHLAPDIRSLGWQNAFSVQTSDQRVLLGPAGADNLASPP